jgi:signal transduction histidine kinase
VNDNFVRVSGCDRDEVIGRTLLELKINDGSQREELEGQLRQAQKMASLGNLAAGIVHDFNNVLHVIRGCSELLLQDSPENNATREKLQQIKGAADRGVSLTRQLLAFSRKQAVEPTTLDLNSLITELKDFLQRLIGKEFELRTIFGPNLSSVSVDPVQFQQVLMNLVVNARDAMPDGGKLTIETATTVVDEAHTKGQMEMPPGRYAMVAVTDAGCGMDAETLSHIFEPFFTTKERGTGLGLATVYGIVKQSGGFVSVYSAPGYGTTFKVFFPAQDVIQHDRFGRS